jgi:lysylphosphatidylglycerol synthetase-like protein (DUF2156 family)
MFKKNVNKTPEAKALGNIKVAYILAFISAGVTLMVSLLASIGGEIISGIDTFAIIDVVLLIVLAILLITKKSRVSAIFLLAHYLISRVVLFLENPDAVISSLFVAIIFIAGYFYGILGTFSYHKLKKEKEMQQPPPSHWQQPPPLP